MWPFVSARNVSVVLKCENAQRHARVTVLFLCGTFKILSLGSDLSLVKCHLEQPRPIGCSDSQLGGLPAGELPTDSLLLLRWPFTTINSKMHVHVSVPLTLCVRNYLTRVRASSHTGRLWFIQGFGGLS